MADRLLRVLPLPPLMLPPIRPVEFAQRGVCDQRAIAPESGDAFRPIAPARCRPAPPSRYGKQDPEGASNQSTPRWQE